MSEWTWHIIHSLHMWMNMTHEDDTSCTLLNEDDANTWMNEWMNMTHLSRCVFMYSWWIHESSFSLRLVAWKMCRVHSLVHSKMRHLISRKDGAAPFRSVIFIFTLLNEDVSCMPIHECTSEWTWHIFPDDTSFALRNEKDATKWKCHVFPWKSFIQSQQYNGSTCHTYFLEMRWHMFLGNSFLKSQNSFLKSQLEGHCTGTW